MAPVTVCVPVMVWSLTVSPPVWPTNANDPETSGSALLMGHSSAGGVLMSLPVSAGCAYPSRSPWIVQRSV